MVRDHTQGPGLKPARAGVALAGVFQILFSEAGRRTREGETQDQIADGLRPSISRKLFGVSVPPERDELGLPGTHLVGITTQRVELADAISGDPDR
jgi:hypothetical protein